MSLPLHIFTPTQAAVLLGIAALLGAVFGSFINCLAWRMAHGESVLAGRSHCTSCGHALGVLDLVPVFSWLALRGRCRHCGAKVSPRYLAVELTLAAVFALMVWQYGIGVPALAYCVLACILMAAALVDLDTFTIPNGFILAALGVWLAAFVAVPLATAGAAPGALAALPANEAARVLALGLSADALAAGTSLAVAPFAVGSLFAPLVGAGWQAVALDGLAGAVAVGGGILLFSLVFDAITRKTSLGGGDVKLLFVVGLYLGVALSLLNLLIACILGLVFAFFRLRAPDAPELPADRVSAPDSPNTSKLAGSPNASESQISRTQPPEPFRTRAFPFGPAIAAATAVTLLAGPALLTWYVALF